MKITHSPETNMAYIYFDIEQSLKLDWGDSFEIKDIMEFSSLYLEFDQNNVLFGIEVSNANGIIPGEILHQAKESFKDTPIIHDFSSQYDKIKNILFLDFKCFRPNEELKTTKYSVRGVFGKGGMNLELDDSGMIWGMEFINATNILPKSFLEFLKI